MAFFFLPPPSSYVKGGSGRPYSSRSEADAFIHKPSLVVSWSFICSARCFQICFSSRLVLAHWRATIEIISLVDRSWLWLFFTSSKFSGKFKKKHERDNCKYTYCCQMVSFCIILLFANGILPWCNTYRVQRECSLSGSHFLLWMNLHAFAFCDVLLMDGN